MVAQGFTVDLNKPLVFQVTLNISRLWIMYRIMYNLFIFLSLEKLTTKLKVMRSFTCNLSIFFDAIMKIPLVRHNAFGHSEVLVDLYHILPISCLLGWPSW